MRNRVIMSPDCKPYSLISAVDAWPTVGVSLQVADPKPNCTSENWLHYSSDHAPKYKDGNINNITIQNKNMNNKIESLYHIQMI